jgi:dynein heavy chain, axonemal
MSIGKELMGLPRRVELVMLELSTEELHRVFIAQSQNLAAKFISKLTAANMEEQNSICQRYEVIQEKALRAPDGFKEMAEQMEYMEVVLQTELHDLLNSLEETRKRLMYLFDVSILTPQHVELNSVTFTWPMRIIPILENHNEIIGDAKAKSKELLKERRTRLELEMSEIGIQVNELREVGELDEVPFYVKKVQGLTKQLVAAQDVIATFNREEQLFGWNLTAYPQRKQIM